VAGKTGTTNDFHDAWFIGYTPELATGVWIGYDSERSLGKDRTGGKVAAPVFRDYMQTALGKAPIIDFPIAEGITFVSVERDSGRPASPESTASFLEAFKIGTEPHYREPEEVAPAYDDDLERTIGRMRARGDGDHYFDDRDLPPPDTAPQDTEEREPRMRDDEEDLDAGRDDRRRPADDGDAYRSNRDRRARPRAEDYLAPLDDHEYDRPTARRRGEAEAGDYRMNAPRRARDIIEEPLD
jgi:membrane peptidoglycan carboxypeptidase